VECSLVDAKVKRLSGAVSGWRMAGAIAAKRKQLEKWRSLSRVVTGTEVGK